MQSQRNEEEPRKAIVQFRVKKVEGRGSLTMDFSFAFGNETVTLTAAETAELLTKLNLAGVQPE